MRSSRLLPAANMGPAVEQKIAQEMAKCVYNYDGLPSSEPEPAETPAQQHGRPASEGAATTLCTVTYNPTGLRKEKLSQPVYR